ncbi:glycoside hydrolase family 79 protein [Auriscalpium vulgare]|uniref:Glycoside hydrolase family 79 protein n=1 Tax=Auriscalpium vulgare TaxID=40419 RepID=A0ACB8RXQ8_9AGAM|nr:glycoside hydrolase family 79 protein [Auriscalpium vulgare]
MFISSLLIIWLCVARPRALAQTVSVTLPLSAPSAAPTISRSLVSFSIEQDRWTDWIGASTKNIFFNNVLQNLKQLSGEATRIRIGADSEDHTNFNPSVQSVQQVFPAVSTIVPYPEATNVTVGNAYYQLASQLPSGTPVIWGVNFGQANITAAFLEARAIATAFTSSSIKNAGVTLEAIEIGNEADLYKNNASRWNTFAANVTATANAILKANVPLIGGAFAESSHSTGGFSPQGIFQNGVLSSIGGSQIKTISQHHYSGSFCSGDNGVLQDLMTKATIRSNLSSFSADISAVHAKGLQYILGETNSYSCHGAPGVSNTAGAALWGLDYALFAAQLGITRVYFHEGIGYKYNFIQPITLTRSILDGSTLSTPLPPHIQPLYYAAVIAAEAIGPSGTTSASQLTVGNAQISGYAFFEGSRLARALFVNLNAFTGASPRKSVHLSLVPSGSGGPTMATVKRLTIPTANATSGVTWGGQTYETSDGKVQGTLSTSTVSVNSGIDIHDTEAVLLTFH